MIDFLSAAEIILFLNFCFIWDIFDWSLIFDWFFVFIIWEFFKLTLFFSGKS